MHHGLVCIDQNYGPSPMDFYGCLGAYSKPIVPKAFVDRRTRLFQGWEKNYDHKSSPLKSLSNRYSIPSSMGRVKNLVTHQSSSVLKQRTSEKYVSWLMKFP